MFGDATSQALFTWRNASRLQMNARNRKACRGNNQGEPPFDLHPPDWLAPARGCFAQQILAQKLPYDRCAYGALKSSWESDGVIHATGTLSQKLQLKVCQS